MPMVVASVGSHGGTSTHIPIEVSALGKGIAVPQLAAGLVQQTELRKDLEKL